MNPRNLSKVTLVIELDDGTRDKIEHSFSLGYIVGDEPRAFGYLISEKQKEEFALRFGELLKQDFIRHMYDIVWAE